MRTGSADDADADVDAWLELCRGQRLGFLWF